MNKIYLTLILIITLMSSCATFGTDVSEIDWPMLSKQTWEKMNLDRLEELVGLGVDVNEAGEVGFSALMLAAELNDNPDIIKYLVSQGADVNYETVSGQTALMSAAMNERTDSMVSSLVENGADVNIENDFGLTALSVAFMFSPRAENLMVMLSNETDELPVSIPDDYDLNHRTSRGYNKLMLELRNNCELNTVLELINSGISLSARDAAGWSTGTIAAVYNTHSEIIELLSEKAVDFNVTSDEGYSTLMLAAARNTEPEIIKRLIDAGEDVNLQTKHGYTALMFAAYAAVNDGVVIALLEGGADAGLETADGLTAWDFIQTNYALKGTRGYWELNDRRLQ